MTLLHLLASDDVSSVLLLVGIPTCGFLIAYSLKVWRNAARHTARVGTRLYLLVGIGGLAISLSGAFVADRVSFIVALNAPPGEFTSTSIYAFAAATFLWPLGWCIPAGAIRRVRRDRLDPPARSVLAALVAGFLTNSLIFVAVAAVGVVAPGKVRALSFLTLSAVAIAVFLAASRQSRHSRLDQTDGVNHDVRVQG